MVISVMVGTVLGFLAGLGVGGGSLLILWLTFVCAMPQETARTVNLLFFIPAAVISGIFRRKQGHLDLKKILPAILAGCTAAAVCSWLGHNLDMMLMKKLFGGLLILTGLRELFYKPKSRK